MDIIKCEATTQDELMEHSGERNTTVSRKTLSIPEAGRVLGIGRSAAYEAARTGQLPTIKIGRRRLVPLVALERMLESAQPAAE